MLQLEKYIMCYVT